MKYILFTIIMAFSHSVLSQTMFRDGYIIKNSGDTIVGKIDYRGELLMATDCYFQSEKSDSITNYSPNDIYGYRFKEGKFFVSKEYNGEKKFFEFMIKGRLNAYFLRLLNGDHYFIENDKLKLKEITYEEYVMEKNGQRYLYKSTKHFGLLKLYMEDASDFDYRINRLRKMNRYELIDIAKDYHYKVCEDEECIIYEKKSVPLSLFLEALGGVIYPVNNLNEQFPQGGIILNFWMPRSNEKLYFRTGVSYINLDYENENYALYRFPIQLGYIYPKYRIRPKFAYGINLYKPLFHTVSFMAGVNIELNKSVFLSVNYDRDFQPWEKLAIVPGKTFTNSIQIGLSLKFPN